MELPISSLSKLNFSAITKVVTATGIEDRSASIFISLFLNIYREMIIANAGKTIIFKNEISNDHFRFFLDCPWRNAPSAKSAIGEAVAPSIVIVFSILSKILYSKFKKERAIPKIIERISGFFARSINSFFMFEFSVL